MNSTARLLCFAAAGLSTMAWAQPAQPRNPGLVDLRAARDANAPTATPGRFILHDVVFFLDGEPMALITDLGRPPARAMFFRADMAPAGCVTKEITREHVVLVDRRSGQAVELKIDGASPEDPAALARRSKEWLTSAENPMLHSVVSPPSRLYENWPRLSDGQKEEIALFYGNYGWRLRAEIIAGALDVTWERTNEPDRADAAAACRANFLALLSADQRQAWDKMQSNPPLYAKHGTMTAELKRIGAERRRAFAEFQASFNPEQRAAFDRMNSLPVVQPLTEEQKSDFVLPHLLPVMPAAPAAPARYTKAWINSHANPMLRQPDWPRELINRWSTLSTSQKTGVIEYFQKHGWQVQYLETVSGSTGSMAWRNIYEEEQRTVQIAKIEAFTASLPPELRKIWLSGALNQTVFINLGKPDYSRNRNPPEQQRIFETFWAGLSAAQKAAYADLHDFTKADWK